MSRFFWFPPLLLLMLLLLYAVSASNSGSKGHCDTHWNNFADGCYIVLKSAALSKLSALRVTKYSPSSICQSLGGTQLSQEIRERLSNSRHPTVLNSTDQDVICQKAFSNCYFGWYEFSGRCVQLTSRQLSWDEAKAACNEIGADMLQVKDEATQTFIGNYLSILNSQSVSHLWIGLYEFDSSKPLRWTSGGDYTDFYQNWAPGEPKLSTRERNAVWIVTDSVAGSWEVSRPTYSRGFVCELPAGQMPVTPTPDTLFSCPTDWFLFRGSCYKFSQFATTWNYARTFCKRESATSDLIDIRDSTEQEFVQRHLLGKGIWVGLHSKENDWGNWFWNDDTMTATYFYWGEGEPNNADSRGEYCVHLWYHNEGRWNDAFCGNPYYYGCKRPADVNGSPPTHKPTVTTPNSLACGPGWHHDSISNLCYWFELEPKTWQDAKLGCQQIGGELTSVTSMAEKSFLSGKIQGLQQNGASALGYWTGFNDLAEEGRWVWSDGAAVSFTNWNVGEPNNAGGEEDCAQIISDTLYWNDERCSKLFASVCKKVSNSGTTSTPPATTIAVEPGQVRGCPDGYSGYNSMCYKFYSTGKTWLDARQVCREDGGDLVSVVDQIEHQFLIELVQKTETDRNLWIGLRNTIAAGRALFFQWSDGSPVTFTKWDLNEPNGLRNEEDCVELRGNGVWNDISCDSSFAFACKRREIPLENTPPTTALYGCPEGYTDAYNGYCYMYVLNGEELTWSEARTKCRSANTGTPLAIQSSSEQGHINLRLNEMKATDPVWIGLYKMSSGSLFWTYVGALYGTSYTNWATGADTSSQYGMMYGSGRNIGTWTLTSSSTKLKSYICRKRQTGATTPSPPPTTYHPEYCAAGWLEADDTCYRVMASGVSSQRLSWEEARHECRLLGGDLASIHSDNATSVIKEAITITNVPYWIGLNSRANPDSHVWSDSSSLSYTNWANREPNNFNKQLNCVQMNGQDGKWRVSSCSSASNYICETPKGTNPGNATTPEPTSPPQLPNCGSSNWKYFNDFCYYASYSSQDWYGARNFCKRQHGDLVSIGDINENDFVLRVASGRTPLGSYWTGLNEIGQNDGYRWSDSSPVGFTNWNVNEPNNAGGAEHCVSMYGSNGLWNDDICGASHRFLCKRNNDTKGITDPSPSPMPGQCPKFYYASGDKCYRMFYKESDVVTWEEAKQKCATDAGAQRAYLASISNEYEQATLTYMSRDAEVDMWIGLKTLSTRRFAWQDNSRFSFSNWDRGEPSGNSQNPEPCTEMYAKKFKEGKWNDIPCNAKRGFICMTYKQPDLSTTWPGTAPTRTLCTDGWRQFGTACYKFVSQPATWQAAQTQCLAQSSNLVSIHDVYEQNYLHSMTKDAENDVTWIGLSDTKSTGTFEWIDNWPVLYTYWGRNQPNDNEDRKCAQLQRGGYWSNAACGTEMPFLCRRSFGSPPSTPATIDGSCPTEDFKKFGSHCYLVSEARISSNRKNFADARFECQRYGGDLVSILSEGEQEFVHRIVENKMQGIGITVTNFWIGLSRQFDGSFKWTDNNAVSYIHWSEGEPSDADGSLGENCVEMFLNGYKWNDVTCSKTNGFVCKVAVTPYTTASSLTTSRPSTISTTTSSTSTSRTTKLTQKPTQQPEKSTTTRRESQTDGGSEHQTGNLINGIHNDTLIMVFIAIILVCLVSIVVGVFFFKRSRLSKSSDETGFVNANWSRESGDVKINESSATADALENPNFCSA